MLDFGRYQLIKRLEENALGELLLGRSVSIDGFGKDVVIARLPADMCDDIGLASVFIHESKLVIGVEHPNVAQIYDFGQVDNVYFLARELVIGCGLNALMALPEVSGQGLPPALALLIVNEVLEGLEQAHNARNHGGDLLGVTHRGVSPSNILLSMDGAVKLAGFGMSSPLERRIRSAPETVLDRLGYLAPEQLGEGPVDHRADVFACGVVLWELLVGKALHVGSASDLLRRTREARIEPPMRHNPAIPVELNELVMGAMARDPGKRFASARDFSRLIFNYLLRHHSEASLYLLQEFLDTHRSSLPVLDLADLPDATHPPSASGAGQTQLEEALTKLALSQFSAPPGLGEAVEAFRTSPRLWQLVEMGDIYRDSNQADAALTAYRVAAVKFAQRALLAHALLCCKRMLALVPMETIRPEIMSLTNAARFSDAELGGALFHNNGPVENLLREMLAGCAPAHGLVGAGTPLLSYLDGNAFADLAEQAELLAFPDGDHIVREGDAGNTMYLIGKGRVVVYATDTHGQPVYLSSLTVGDFFGENSFFTGAPRSATVEALGDVEAFAIDKALYERVIGDNAHARTALLDFYKERIVNAVLAKSQIFGLLPSDERQALVYRFNLKVFQPGELVLREGDISDSIYLIKSGEAEVFTEKGGPRTALSTIGPGTVFGEVAALRGIARTASIAAKTSLETLELSGSAFHAILQARPDLQQKVFDVVARRARENMDKVGGPAWLMRR